MRFPKRNFFPFPHLDVDYVRVISKRGQFLGLPQELVLGHGVYALRLLDGHVETVINR